MICLKSDVRNPAAICCSHFRPATSVYQALKDALEIMTGPLSDEIGKYQAEKDAAELLLATTGYLLKFPPRCKIPRFSRMKSNSGRLRAIFLKMPSIIGGSGSTS